MVKVNAMDLAHAPTIADKPQARSAGMDGAAHGVTVRLLSPAEAARPAFRTCWEALAVEATEPNPFLEPWFLLPSLSALDSQDCVIAACFSGERLIGLVPLSRPRRYYGYPVPHRAAWLHENAFCGAPLALLGHERGFWRALLAHLDDKPGAALFLHLPELPADGPMARALDAVLAEDERHAVTVDDAERAMLASDLDAESYLAQSMSAKKRKELRRQHKRLSEEGELVFERATDAAAIEAWIDDFLALEAAGWKGEAGSALASQASTRSVFTDALGGAAAAGRLERLALRLDGKPIAMLANFIAAPGAFSFKTAFDERYSRYSPGLLLQLENLALLDREDIEWTDSCAAEGHSMIERVWREKRRIVARNIAIGGSLRRAAFSALMAYETRNRKGV